MSFVAETHLPQADGIGLVGTDGFPFTYDKNQYAALISAPIKLTNDPTVTPFPRTPHPAAQPRAARPAPDDQRVVGFGDDLPDFLRRAPRIAARA